MQCGFAEAFLPAGFGRNARLERITGLIDWLPVEALVKQVRPGTTGRPPYRALVRVKALLLKQWYGLSDPGLEEALSDRVSFRRLCGLSLEEPTPDETTLCRFRLALVAAGLGDALFAEVSRQLDAAGYMVKTGTLIDASLVEASVRRPPDGSTPKGDGQNGEGKGEESRSPHDGDANWTRAGKQRGTVSNLVCGRA